MTATLTATAGDRRSRVRRRHLRRPCVHIRGRVASCHDRVRPYQLHAPAAARLKAAGQRGALRRHLPDPEGSLGTERRDRLSGHKRQSKSPLLCKQRKSGTRCSVRWANEFMEGGTGQMRLGRIRVDGFRKLVDTECTVVGRVTALIGPNEAGKSSLLARVLQDQVGVAACR